MAVALLRRHAVTAPVPIFPAIGAGMRDVVDDLFLDKSLVRAESIRHARILLVAGQVRETDRGDLGRLHDEMPHPRATVWWHADPLPAFPDPVVVAGMDDPAGVIETVDHSLLDATRKSEADLLPDEPPNPWRGKGDHGQGGKGMMGGTPYGRPMAMTDDDLRDGLALDAYTAAFGPFLPMLPPGLKLSLTLQGDVIQTAKVLTPPHGRSSVASPQEASLRDLAQLLRLLGLSGHAERCILAARDMSRGRTADVGAIARLVRWSGAALAIPPDIGKLDGADVRDRFLRLVATATGEAGSDNESATSSKNDLSGRLIDLLPGREWSEAMLIANSFDADALAAIAQVEKKEEEPKHDSHAGHAEHEHHHGEHGHHSGGRSHDHHGEESRTG